MRNYKLLFFSSLLALACAEEEVGPVLMDSDSFEAPSIINETTRPSEVFALEDFPETYEVLQWERTNYGGINLSTTYVVEIDKTEDFDAPKTLMTTSADSALITVENINNAMISLGLPPFEEATAYIRLKSTVNGTTDTLYTDALYSGVITRSATTFQSSECGKFCTIGIIGSATPGGWDTDTDMRLADATRVDKSIWTTIIFLTGGNQVKFRASDAWTDNWGGTSFPSGTGAAGGADITVNASGYYKVTFNEDNLAYSFTLLSTPTYTTIGIIGSGTPGGWDSDTNLTQDGGDPHVWTGTVALTEGEAKFRANDDWANNWGSTTYPSGFGIGNGANIPVKAGTYAVRFNDATGEYQFMPVASATPYTTVGIIGSATPGGWDNDTDMTKNPSNPFLWSKIFTLTEAEAKFRAENGWDVNWGASAFPGGISSAGGANIPTKAGTYFVTFNTGTGEYYFLK